MRVAEFLLPIDLESKLVLCLVVALPNGNLLVIAGRSLHGAFTGVGTPSFSSGSGPLQDRWPLWCWGIFFFRLLMGRHGRLRHLRLFDLCLTWLRWFSLSLSLGGLCGGFWISFRGSIITQILHILQDHGMQFKESRNSTGHCHCRYPWIKSDPGNLIMIYVHVALKLVTIWLNANVFLKPVEFRRSLDCGVVFHSDIRIQLRSASTIKICVWAVLGSSISQMGNTTFMGASEAQLCGSIFCI